MSKRIIAHVTTGYEGEGGQAVLLQRGEEVELEPDVEARLDELGALVPEGWTLDQHIEANLDVYRAPRGDTIAQQKLAEAMAQAKASGGVVDLSESASLAEHIRSNQPNAEETIALANGDPARAQEVLDAEHEATGGEPRKTVVEGLQKITAGSE